MIAIAVLIFSFDIAKAGVRAQFPLEQRQCKDLCPGINLNNVDLHAVKFFSSNNSVDNLKIAVKRLLEPVGVHPVFVAEKV